MQHIHTLYPVPFILDEYGLDMFLAEREYEDACHETDLVIAQLFGG